MCCTNQPCSLRGSTQAATSSKALLDAFASYLQSLSATHDLMLTERTRPEDELWEMRFRAIEEPLSRCIGEIKLLIVSTKAAAAELQKPDIAKDKAAFLAVYKGLDYKAIDAKYDASGAHVRGESALRIQIQQALAAKGDEGGYEVILKQYEELLPAAELLAQKIKAARDAKKWRDHLVDPSNGLNDASSALMGKFLSAKIAQAYFTGYYMHNVRVSEGLA